MPAAMEEAEPPHWIIVERKRLNPRLERFLKTSYFPLQEFRSYLIYQRESL